ncbi:DUF397 domain-containing protein [Streptomyces sp. NPDC096323]|uniref:DUF397 domain-containing protein n=1 Tax=Streptomyces sp. NPDC096323 TaxID=3155822 RepID=UPI003318862F
MIRDASTLPVTWWKSSYTDTGNCVECGIVDASAVVVRDSKRPTGPAIVFSRQAMAAMVGAVAAGTL